MTLTTPLKLCNCEALDKEDEGEDDDAMDILIHHRSTTKVSNTRPEIEDARFDTMTDFL